VYAPNGSDEPISLFTDQTADPPPTGSVAPPLRLVYSGRSHYDVLRDPALPDAGVGLGLPDLTAGAADEAQLAAAAQASEAEALEAALLATAAADSDAAATEAAIEAQVLAASLASLPAARQAPGGGSEADSTCSALVAMGFAAAAAREAAARFGADLDSAVEYLAG